MATAQGKVKVSGVDTPGVYYAALFHRPGSITQWRRVVRLTDGTGVYQVAISEDNFMGTNFVAQNGDKLVVLFWRDTTQSPVKNPGEAYENVDTVSGIAGDHEVGFKYDSGANAVSNYNRANQYAAIVFDITGDGWNATPDGGGIGDVNGNITLQTNLGPSAVLAGLSTVEATPTDITRLVSEALNNTSGDNENRVVTANGEVGQLYSQFGQLIFQAVSAAHNPSGGAQTADGSDVDGSRYRLFNGIEYGNVFGTITAGAGGTLDGADQVYYEGPSFVDHDHTWPHIDVYPIRLTTKDDAGIDTGSPATNPALTATDDFYVRTTYRAPGLTFLAREWASWTDHVANSGSPTFSAANPNTVRDVVRVTPSKGGLDNPITPATRYQDAVGATNGIVAIGGQPSHVAIKNDPWSAGLIYGRFDSDVDLSASVVGQLTINSVGIGRGIQAADLAVGEIPGFLNIITQTPVGGGVSVPVLHSYQILVAPGNDAVTINADTSLQVYSDSDWWFVSNEPGGGNRARWEWEVSEGAGYATVGRDYQQLTGSAIGPGTTISRTGIGEGVWPGMFLHVVNGSTRGWFQIGSVPNDDTIELVPGDALPGAVQPADTIAIGFPSQPMKYPQRDNDALDFRINYQYTNGWSQTGGEYWEMDRSSAPVLTDTGSVDNIDPEAVIPAPVPVAGNAATYIFDGRESYGTQVTSWVQGGPLGADIPTVNGGSIAVGASVAFSDPALDNTNLRDNGHAVLIFTDVAGLMTYVFPIVDLDHANNTQVFLDTSGVLGAVLNYSIGQNFRTANDYEIEAGGNVNDIASYTWELRSDTVPLPPLGVNDPAFPAWWAGARQDATGTGSTFQHTYPQGDDGRIAVIDLTVVDEDAAPGGNSPGSTSKYLSFVVDVTPGGGTAGVGLRRLEWD